MGLRTASVRQPNVVVMAPALTESSQTQNFTPLPPPSSPPSFNNSADDDAKQQHQSPSQKHHHVNQIKCALFNTPDFLEYLTHTLPIIETTKTVRKLPIASDQQQQDPEQPATTSLIIMNHPSMGDEENTMGLVQKTQLEPPMAQLLKQETTKTTTSTSDTDVVDNLLLDDNLTMSTTDVINDDLMQVFKTIENQTDRIPNESIFPITFDRELFGEVDMMQICAEDDQAKETRARELIDELTKKQLKLERRTEYLLRRLRKVQIRGMGQHVSDEVAGLFELADRELQRTKQQQQQSDLLNLEEPRNELPPHKTIPITRKTKKTLVQNIHVATMQQSTMMMRQKHCGPRYFGAGSIEPLRTPAVSSSFSLPPLPVDCKDELERVAGTLQSQLTMIEQQMDSDDTGSSSGGESCDEMQIYNNPHQEYLSICKRAAWRYAKERAAIASRWTWLQAQISDLEYRIRQHNDFHRQIRLCKGAVTLGENTSIAHPKSTPASPSTVNGYRGQLPGATKSSEDLLNGVYVTTSNNNNNNSNSGTSARTRPLQRSTFKKRKLLQTTGLHTVSKKASRPSNIRCKCTPQVVPCAICTGRTDPTFPRDFPEQLTVPERIALLDPGYHPVLSFSDDVSQSIHLEAIMKLPDWQQKMLKCNVKLVKGLQKSEKNFKKAEHSLKKYNKMLKSGTAVNMLHNKIKSKIARGRKPSTNRTPNMVRFNNKRRYNSHNSSSTRVSQCASTESMEEDEMDEAFESMVKSPGGSLTPSPLSHVLPYNRRNQRADSYDIDNIVIPYSIAATTRLEILQYKEILTPKWRKVKCDDTPDCKEKINGVQRSMSGGESEVEDMSDEVFVTRHEVCEQRERKKFQSYIKFPLSVGRSRANRRTDSRAESTSGANTPDPLSPHNSINQNISDIQTQSESTPINSPPATPVSVTSNHDDSSSTTTNTMHHNLHQAEKRRRTVSSSSRWIAANKERVELDDTDSVEQVVAPYETRTFPLADDIYEFMLKLMPDPHPLPRPCSPPVSVTLNTSVTSERADTPISDSTESAIAEEDPNDPEWINLEGVRDHRSKR